MKKKYISAIIVFAFCLQIISGLAFAVEESALPLASPVPVVEEEKRDTTEEAISPDDANATESDATTQMLIPDISAELQAQTIENNNNNYNTQQKKMTEEEIEQAENAAPQLQVAEQQNPALLMPMALPAAEDYAPSTFASPFAISNTSSEQVTLNQGSLSYSYNILSLPGKNGLDLNLSLKYNSANAIIDTPQFQVLYNATDAKKDAVQDCFYSPGWEISVSYIDSVLKKGIYSAAKQVRTLHLADGRSFEIDTKNGELKLIGQKLNDISIAYGDNNDFRVTYHDGRIELFDMDNGYLKETRDRFGNKITYHYEEVVDLYRISYNSYLYEPSTYMRSFYALSSITDSLGRVITIQNNNYSYDKLGKSINNVKFIVDGKTQADVKFKLMETSFGTITVLDSVKDVLGHQTSFEYVEKVTGRSYYNESTSSDTYQPGTHAHVLLEKITFPTGGSTHYQYEAFRKYYLTNTTGYEECYKVTARWDEIDGEKINIKEYGYLNDSSGYPQSYLSRSQGKEGDIWDESMQYHTLVQETTPSGDTTKTLYTFNNKHLKIREEIIQSDNTDVFQTLGTSRKANTFYAGTLNYMFKLTVNYNKIAIEMKHSGPFELYDVLYLANPVQSKNIIGVKTYQEDLLIFYESKQGWLGCIRYEPESKSYTELASVDCTSIAGYSSMYNYIKNVAQAAGNFYILYERSDYLYMIKFNVTSNTWSLIDLSTQTGISGATDVNFIGSYGGNAYYNVGKNSRYKLYKYNGTSWTAMGTMDMFTEYGFANASGVYALEDNVIKLFEGTTSTTYAAMPPNVNTDKYPFMIDAANDVFCVVEQDSGTYKKGVYKLNKSSKTWEFKRHVMFEGYECASVSAYGDTLAMLPYYKNNYLGSVEMINVYEPYDKQRIRSETVYDRYGLPASQTSTSYSADGQIKQTTSTSTYNSYGDLTRSVDVMGNIAEYTYYTNYYSLPQKATVYKGTANETVTDYTLTTDNKNIGQSVTYLEERNLVNRYTYSGGNITNQKVYQQIGIEETLLDDTYYEYSAAYNSAYLTKTYKNLSKINNANFIPAPQTLVTGQFTYDNFGRVTTATDASGGVTTTAYKDNGWVEKTTNPDGTWVDYTYELKNGGLLAQNKQTASLNGTIQTVYSYDDLGRPVEHRQTGKNGGLDLIVAYEYDINGRVSTQQDIYSRIAYGYDYLGRVISQSTTLPDGTGTALTKQIEYDDFGLKTTVTDELGKKQSSYYDDLMRQIKVESWLDETTKPSTVYEYDAAGNLLKQTDANNKAVTYTYNKQGHVLTTVNALGQTTQYEYDILGNLLETETAGGSTVVNEYDSLNRIIKRTDALGQTEEYAYDNLGNLIKGKDRKNVVTTNAYIAHTGLISSTQTGNNSISYAYNEYNSLETVTDNGRTVSMEYYDNQLLKSVDNNGLVQYDYDVLGNVTSMTDPNNKTLTYQYGVRGRLEKIKEGSTVVASYTYNNNDTLGTISYQGGASSSFVYDNLNRVTGMTNTLGGTNVNTYSYTYDNIGNQLTKTDNTGTTSYQYDEVNRLKSVEEPDGTATEYAFDQNGNIMTKSIAHPSSYSYKFKQGGTEYTMGNIATHTVNYTYDKNNRLLLEREFVGGDGEAYSGLVESTTQYEYDANGNTLKQTKSGQIDTQVVEYVYDELNRLTQYTDAEDSVTSYTYDYNGQRLSKTVDGVTTGFVWDRGYIINETKGNVKTTNLVGIGGVFARQSGNNRDYFLKNAHGDVTAVTNGSAVTKTYEYDAYGVEKNPDANDTNPFRYCGEYFDKESGSIYLRNRYYNPSIPRFITEDSYWRTKDAVYGESALNAANIIKAEYSTYVSNETIYQYDYSGETASEIKDKIIKNDPNVLPELIKEYKNIKQTDKYPVAAAIIQSNNLYAYCMNNPVIYVDPNGNKTTSKIMTGWKAWAKLASIAIDLGINAATLAAIVAAIAGSALPSGGAGAVAVGVAAAGKLVDSAVRGSYDFVMLVTGIVCMIKDGAYIYTEVTLDNSNEVIDAIINFPIIEPT